VKQLHVYVLEIGMVKPLHYVYVFVIEELLIENEVVHDFVE
jgi:hypothetical protein